MLKKHVRVDEIRLTIMTCIYNAQLAMDKSRAACGKNDVIYFILDTKDVLLGIISLARTQLMGRIQSAICIDTELLAKLIKTAQKTIEEAQNFYLYQQALSKTAACATSSELLDY